MAKRKKLKPAGHSAAIEALVQPAIVIASTLMSSIAAYVLASDELKAILSGQGSPVDWFIVVLCAGMGFLIDMAIIVSATRYKMHAIRRDPHERGWKRLSVIVLTLGLTSESMTLLYFFVSSAPGAFPSWLAAFAESVHSALAISRAFMPPIIVAYFVAGILPVVIERSDRNREVKSRTSQDIATLVDRLAEVEETDDKTKMLTALGGLLALNTYASYDTDEQLNEDEQVARDNKLLARLAQLHGLDWGALQVVSVAPAPLGLSAPAEASESDQAPVYIDQRSKRRKLVGVASGVRGEE